MKIIVCTGDSHTWGQGVSRATELYGGEVRGGDLRPTAFDTDGYVNLLRRTVEADGASFSRQLIGEDLAKAIGRGTDGRAVKVGAGDRLDFSGELLRLYFETEPQPQRVAFSIDSEKYQIELEGYDGDRPERMKYFRVPAGDHTLVFSSDARIYCAEYYGGSACVINAGVGSTPSGKYLAEYFTDYAAELFPDVILAEAHSVNDWLNYPDPAEAEAHLTALLKACLEVTPKTALLTVAPVGGRQIPGHGGSEFSLIAGASLNVARKLGIPVADAWSRLKDLDPESESYRRTWLSDNWHPNEKGHALYAKLLREVLKEL